MKKSLTVLVILTSLLFIHKNLLASESSDDSLQGPAYVLMHVQPLSDSSIPSPAEQKSVGVPDLVTNAAIPGQKAGCQQSMVDVCDFSSELVDLQLSPALECVLQRMDEEIYYSPSNVKWWASYLGPIPIAGLAAYALSLILANDGAVQGFFKIAVGDIASIKGLGATAAILYGTLGYFTLNKEFLSWKRFSPIYYATEKALPWWPWKFLKGGAIVLSSALAAKIIKLLYTNTFGLEGTHTTWPEFIFAALPLFFTTFLETHGKVSEKLRGVYNDRTRGSTPRAVWQRQQLEDKLFASAHAVREVSPTQLLRHLEITHDLDVARLTRIQKAEQASREAEKYSAVHPTRTQLMEQVATLKQQGYKDLLELTTLLTTLDHTLAVNYTKPQLPRGAVILGRIGMGIDGAISLGLSGFGAYYALSSFLTGVGVTDIVKVTVGGVIYAVPMTLWTTYLSTGGTHQFLTNFYLRAAGKDPADYGEKVSYAPNNLKRLRNGMSLLAVGISYLLSLPDSGLTAFQISHMAMAIGDARHALAYAMMGTVNVAQAMIALKAIDLALQRIVTLAAQIPHANTWGKGVPAQLQGAFVSRLALMAEVIDSMPEDQVAEFHQALEPKWKAIQADTWKRTHIPEHAIDTAPIAMVASYEQPLLDQRERDIEMQEMRAAPAYNDDLDDFTYSGALQSLGEGVRAARNVSISAVKGTAHIAKGLLGKLFGGTQAKAESLMQWWGPKGWGRQPHASIKVPA